jgi:hypothetical protein
MNIFDLDRNYLLRILLKVAEIAESRDYARSRNEPAHVIW